MSGFLLGLISQFWPYLLMAGAAVAWGIKQRFAGRADERAKQATRDAVARQERHEMDREAGAIERKARDLTDEEARAEAMKWVKR